MQVRNVVDMDAVRERARHDSSVVIEEPTRFSPWPLEKVRTHIARLRALTVRERDTARVRALVDADDDLYEFVTLYETLASKLMDVAFCENEHLFATLMKIVAVREDVERGAATEDDARRRVSATVLAAALPSSHPAQSSLRDHAH